MRRLIMRGPKEIALDLLFVAWMLQVAVTGQLMPQQIADLLNPPQRITAVSEPAPPATLPVPIVDALPET